jgi:hypothetical protein
MEPMRYQFLRQFPIPLQIILISGIGLLLGIISVWAPPFLIIAAIAGIAYVAIVWAWPEVAVLILLIFTSTIFDVNALQSIPIGIGHLIVTDFLVFIPLGIILLRTWVEPGYKFIHTPLDLPLLAFYGIALLSTFLAIYQSKFIFNQSLGELRSINFYLVFFIVTNSIRDEKRLRRLIRGIFILAVLVAGAMIIQYALGDSVVILPGRVEELGTAGTVSPGVTRILPPGQSLVLVVLIALPILLIFDRSRSKFLTRFFQVFIVSLAVLLTFNRSFWVALILALSVAALLISVQEKVRFIKIGIWVGLAGSIGLVLVLILLGSQAQKLIDGSVIRMSTLVNPNTVNEGSLRDRYVENEYAYPQIIAHPLIGLGLGADYRKWDRRIDFTPISTWDRFAYIHDGHLWMMLKTGLLGYFFYILTLILFLKRGFQAWLQNPSPYYKGIVFSFTITVIGLLPATIVNPIFSTPYWTSVLGVMLGINEVIFRFIPKRTLDLSTIDSALPQSTLTNKSNSFPGSSR